MNPLELLDILSRVQARIHSARKKLVSATAERRSIQSVVRAWFSEYKRAFADIIGEGGDVAAMDEIMQDLLKLASAPSARRTVERTLSAAVKHFTDRLLVPVTRAYWSRAPQTTPAGRDDEAAARLRDLDRDLADSYEQAVLDIQEPARMSYRGPAAELREVLTGVLHILAPNPRVEATDWYREARRFGNRTEPTPTRAERIKFILRERTKGSAITQAGESFMSSVEERLASVVNATYKRGSAATHGGTEREELIQLLPYVNAILRELLPVH